MKLRIKGSLKHLDKQIYILKFESQINKKLTCFIKSGALTRELMVSPYEKIA